MTDWLRLCQKWGYELKLPTIEQLIDVYNLPDESDTENFLFKKRLLFWYQDRWLVAFAGNDFFKGPIRHIKMAVESVEVEGTKQQCVPKEAEAMGLLMLHNCYKKWKEVCPVKLANPRWEAPNFDPDDKSTHKWHATEWTDPRSGQVQGGGWKPEAYKQFNAYVVKVKNLRAQDKKNNWKLYKRANQVLNELTDAKKKSNKRKRQPVKEVPVYESEQSFSDDDCAYEE